MMESVQKDMGKKKDSCRLQEKVKEEAKSLKGKIKGLD